ncbi:unnamed protein product [Gadus morhua 'NCC']
MIYLGEPVHHLIKECQDMQENEAAMAIVSGNEDIKIIIDGTEVGADLVVCTLRANALGGDKGKALIKNRELRSG